MSMNTNKIDQWLNSKNDSVHIPTESFVNRLKKIPAEVNSYQEDFPMWITWVAAASFVGIMLLNLNYLNNSSQDDKVLDSYFSNSINYGS